MLLGATAVVRFLNHMQKSAVSLLLDGHRRRATAGRGGNDRAGSGGSGPAALLPGTLVANPEGLEVKEQAGQRYAAIHIERPFDNPFSTIPGAYHTLGDYMRTNGLVLVENGVIACFETAGDSMDVYLACKNRFE